MNPPYDEMPSQIRSTSGQFDGHSGAGTQCQLGWTTVASPIRSHW